MTNYAHTNLRNLDDVTPPEMDQIEGRFARTPLESRDLGVSLFTYAPGFRSSGGHSHREQEEAYVVIAGSGQILVDGEVIDLAQWDVVRLAPEAVRAMSAGPDGLEVIAIGGPKPEGGDGVREEVTWPED